MGLLTLYSTGVLCYQGKFYLAFCTTGEVIFAGSADFRNSSGSNKNVFSPG